MNIHLPVRERGTVSERHERRIVDLEAVTARLLTNEAKLIADAVTAQRALALALELIESLRAEDKRIERDMDDLGARVAPLPLPSGTFWGRLRWLALGR
jgi:hypothetical protein